MSMSKHLSPDEFLPVEQALTDLYTLPELDPAFVARLEQQLVAQTNTAVSPNHQPANRQSLWHRLFSQRSQSDSSVRRPPSAVRTRWATAVILCLLALGLVLAAVGPQRAWAALQSWLGYVPGIGFVEWQDTAVLPSPVSLTQDGITLHVEQVVARPDRTSVVIRSEGLPREDRLWPHGGQHQATDYTFELHMPDGRILISEIWTLRLGGGTLTFPPLPEDVTEVTLVVGRLPLVPPGLYAENWQMLLSLQPATTDLITALYPQPYIVTEAAVAHHDITVAVLEVAHTPEETAVLVQVEWDDPAWLMFHLYGGMRSPYLVDENGRTYRQTTPSSGGSQVQTIARRVDEVTPTPVVARPAFRQVMHFEPVSPLVQQLTLVVDGLEFRVQIETAFTFDLGPDPQVGDSWPMDLHLDVAGFPVHITAARLIEIEPMPTGPGRNAPQIPARIALQFDIEPVPTLGNTTLHGFGLDGSRSGFTGGGSGSITEDGRRQRAVAVFVHDPMPTGIVTITIPDASIVWQGPWEVSWPVP
jgi:hypothetical protein